MSGSSASDGAVPAARTRPHLSPARRSMPGVQPGREATPRKRWWLQIVLVMAAGLVALPWLVPPERVADLLLRQLGPGLQLELIRNGPASWKVRGGPMLEMHDLEVGQIGTDTPWLHADRVLLAVPWRTVRSLGKTLDFTRIEVDSPRLSLPALRLWLDSRAPGEGDVALPALSNGLEIRNGQLQGDGWKINSIVMQFPDFAPDLPVRGKFSGRYMDKATQAGFDLRLAMTRPALPAGAAIVGSLDIQGDMGSIPARFTLSGPLRLKDGQWRIPALRLALEGELSPPDSPPLPLSLNLGGALETGETIALSPLTLEFSGSGPLPSLTATGEATFNQQLHLHLIGEMPLWPRTWPILPPPLSQRNRLGFTLDYTGALDLSGKLELQLQRGPTRLDASIRPDQLADWLSRDRDTPSPLPPLQGRLSTPTLELPGIILHGIEVDVESEP